tara:strand:- start:583 stop:1023 length:441 start_codon:yes stop_codon:yes gene_type:complete
MRTHLLVLLPVVMALSSCGDDPVNEENPDMIRPQPEVQAMREIAGRWQSREGVLPGQDGRYVLVDIANDKTISFELRMVGAKMPIVVAEARGDLVANEDLTAFSGEIPDAPEDLAVIRSFSFEKPASGAIRIKGNSASFDVTYQAP